MVVIKGFEMPKNCFECDFGYVVPSGGYCGITNQKIEEGFDVYENTDKFPSQCPIEEVN